MRLIDADALRKKAQWMEMPDHQGINFDVRAVSVSSIDLTPTIDAVPVIRCKDCRRRYDIDECPMCVLHINRYFEYTMDDGFCDRGERRDNNA